MTMHLTSIEISAILCLTKSDNAFSCPAKSRRVWRPARLNKVGLAGQVSLTLILHEPLHLVSDDAICFTIVLGVSTHDCSRHEISNLDQRLT